jgi:hypothetical protein
MKNFIKTIVLTPLLLSSISFASDIIKEVEQATEMAMTFHTPNMSQKEKEVISDISMLPSVYARASKYIELCMTESRESHNLDGEVCKQIQIWIDVRESYLERVMEYFNGNGDKGIKMMHRVLGKEEVDAMLFLDFKDEIAVKLINEYVSE